MPLELEHPRKRPRDILAFIGALLGTMVYFALSMRISQPRYLFLFPAALHPKLHI